MSTFRTNLLTQVTGICQELFERRLKQVIEQQLVSDKAKSDITVLIVQLNHLRDLDPFPQETDMDTYTLTQLKADIAAEDGNDDAIQAKLLTWAQNSSGVSTENAPTVTPTPLNQRMLDNLDSLRTTIDRTRGRVLFDDGYDQAAYVKARNAYTLARTVYQKRLQLNQIETTNEQAATMEDEIIAAIDTATAAKFPKELQASADFMRKASFPPAA